MKSLIISTFLSVCFITGGCSTTQNTKMLTITNKAQLKANVKRAKNHLEANYDVAIEDFGVPNSKWRSDSIYFFILDPATHTIVFHPIKPQLVGQDLKDQKDSNGVFIMRNLVKAGTQSDGGFVEYLWDNPAITGFDQSKKVTFVTSFVRKSDNKVLLVGTGYYKSSSHPSVN